MRTTFSKQTRHTHEANRRRLERIEKKARDKQQQLDDECRLAPTHKAVMRILVRRAVQQYRSGHEAIASVPLYFYDTRPHEHDYGHAYYFQREPEALAELLSGELSDLVKAFVDCEFKLRVEVGYDTDTETEDSYVPTTVTLTLQPD